MQIIIIPESPIVWLIIAGLLVCGVGIGLYQWLRPPAWQKLLQDDRYRQALKIYAATVRQEEAMCDVRRKALAVAIEYLVNDHGIPAAEAESNLRRIVVQYAREQSYELRNEAVAYEQEGSYDQALDCYQRAAWWQEDHDPKDYQFLQRCVTRVRGKARSR